MAGLLCFQTVDVGDAAFSVPPQQLITHDGGIIEIGAEVRRCKHDDNCNDDNCDDNVNDNNDYNDYRGEKILKNYNCDEDSCNDDNCDGNDNDYNDYRGEKILKMQKMTIVMKTVAMMTMTMTMMTVAMKTMIRV